MTEKTPVMVNTQGLLTTICMWMLRLAGCCQQRRNLKQRAFRLRGFWQQARHLCDRMYTHPDCWQQRRHLVTTQAQRLLTTDTCNRMYIQRLSKLLTSKKTSSVHLDSKAVDKKCDICVRTYIQGLSWLIKRWLTKISQQSSRNCTSIAKTFLCETLHALFFRCMHFFQMPHTGKDFLGLTLCLSAYSVLCLKSDECF